MRTADVHPAEPRAPLNYAAAMESLLDIVQHLYLARNMQSVTDIARRAARTLTGAEAATVVLGDGDQFHIAEADASESLCKAPRFSMRKCISGWAMTHREPAVIEDICNDPRIPADACRSRCLRSMAVVPIGSAKPIGAIGAYWKSRHRASPEEIKLLQALASATAVVLDNVGLYAQLEKRVRERTTQLQAANEEIRQLSLTDELTGLYNRRGFSLLATQQLRAARRTHSSVWLLFADVDSLKPVNDQFGHKAGDRLLCAAARALRDTFRELDVVARFGGDEFAVFGMTANLADQFQQRLEDRVQRYNARCEPGLALSLSIGVVRCDPQVQVSLEKLLDQADEAMYANKRTRTGRPVAQAAG